MANVWCHRREEYALMKLKREATEEGVFLVRWSAIDYHRLLLVVLGQNKASPIAVLLQPR